MSDFIKQFLSLSRPRTNTAFIPELDGFRFIAISLVILHHNHYVLRNVLPEATDHGPVWHLYCTIVNAGGLGVPLFFIVSGVVLGLPFARSRLNNGPPVSLRAYFVRRVRRLEPPYFINLTLLFALAVLSEGTEKFFERLPHYLASLVYLHNTIYNEWSEVNFVAWSLEVEAQFYFLAPLLAIAFVLRVPQLRFLSLVLAMVGMSAVFMVLSDGPFRYTHSILALGQYFLAGFLLADLLVTGRLYARSPSAIYDVFAVVLLAVSISLKVGWPHPDANAFGVFPLLLFFLVIFRGRFFLAALRLRPIFTIGGMCYTIYLYHFWIIQAPVRAFGMDAADYTPAQVFLFDGAMMVFVFVTSAALFVLFERPFMNRRTASRGTGSAAADMRGVKEGA